MLQPPAHDRQPRDDPAAPREPTLEEDVAAERARFDARKAEHVKALADYAERMKPHALKTAGITTDSRVNDKTRCGSRPRSRRARSCGRS